MLSRTMVALRATLAALCLASAAATQPTLDSLPARPSLRKKFDASPYLRGAIGGAAYGLAAAAISHPFDTIKTRLCSADRSLSFAQVLRQLQNTGGLGQLYIYSNSSVFAR